jgi:hypothetical protein
VQRPAHLAGGTLGVELRSACIAWLAVTVMNADKPSLSAAMRARKASVRAIELVRASASAFAASTIVVGRASLFASINPRTVSHYRLTLRKG